jgi:glycerophosphoryl diester phosphodiesterase
VSGAPLSLLTRRAFGLAGMGLGAGLAVGCASADPERGRRAGIMTARPIVIAHRGASGERPEHTMAAYRLAIAQGADFIEPDLVPTKDGVLVARHENEISQTTDVSTRPEFADRRATRSIDGEAVTGWFVEDFTLAELKTLRCRERLPQLRPTNTEFDGQEAIPTFAEIVELALTETARAGRVIGIYPELKHPTYFASRGVDVMRPLLAELDRAGLNRRDSPVFIQCFEFATLQKLRSQTSVRLVMLIDAKGQPADFAASGDSRTYADFLTMPGLRALRRVVDGIGPAKALLIPRDASEASTAATDLVGKAHAAGLLVHPWTFRAENYFLPRELRQGDPTAADYLRLHGLLQVELRTFLALGVDGVFCDFPAAAIAARG